MVERPCGRAELEELARTQAATLVELILQQSERLRAQARALAALEERVQELEKQLEEALRQSGGGGGAAPFRIEPQKRKSEPKPPGRALGHRGEFRAVPAQIDQTIEVPLRECPGCGGALEKTIPLRQTIIELPEVRPVVCASLRTGRAARIARGGCKAPIPCKSRPRGGASPGPSWGRAPWPVPRSCVMAWA